MWKEKVNKIMGTTGAQRANGKIASERTQTLTREVVRAAFRRLHELGYKIQDPHNLGERHIAVLVKDWWLVKHKKPKTMQNELSRLRVFCSKIGKGGMVGRIEKYLPDVDPSLLKVRAVAHESKSWAEHGIDVVAKFAEVDARDPRLGLMLRLELAFGLRREEALKCDPHAQDFGHYLQVFPGMGKGGRWRNIPILSEAQRATLEFVKARSPKNTPLGWEFSMNGKRASLEQNIRRYENLMASLGFTKADSGITGHGLRAQFAENHSLLLGVLPPTLGGTSQQMERDDLKLNRTRLAQALGHNRNSITNAYVGSFSAKGAGTDAASRPNDIGNVINNGMGTLHEGALPPVPAERETDCRRIQALSHAQGMAMSLELTHALWQAHSRRHGVEWMTPARDIPLALETEAFVLFNKSTTVKKGL